MKSGNFTSLISGLIEGSGFYYLCFHRICCDTLFWLKSVKRTGTSKTFQKDPGDPSAGVARLPVEDFFDQIVDLWKCEPSGINFSREAEILKSIDFKC